MTAMPSVVPKLGLALPSFRDDPEDALAVARAAEAAGLDGVFVYDHLFRTASAGERRPALEMTAMLGALAVETSSIRIGSLVARASLRPPATLAAALDTVARLAPDRLVVTVGSGDSESQAENESFGLLFGTMAQRVEQLAAVVDELRVRPASIPPYPVWVGGNSTVVRELAAGRADGWNRWGGSASRFAEDVAGIQHLARTLETGRRLTFSWGGLAVVGDDDAEAGTRAARLRADRPGVLVGGPQVLAEELGRYVTAGAEWLIIGPIDSSRPENAARLGEHVAPLLRAQSSVA